MIYLVSMAAGLYASWLLLSGHYTVLLISLGAASVVLVTWLASRMRLADSESVPIHILLRALLYVPWLGLEILKSNLYVARVVLSPTMPIKPVMARYDGSQNDDLGRFVFANSVTLTPGTITTGVYGTVYEIHALTQNTIDGTEEGTMDRRVTGLTGP